MDALPRTFKRCLCGALLLGSAACAAAAPLRFEGVPFDPRTLRVERLDVAADGSLAIDLGGQEPATIAPWPAALPAHLGAQYVTLRRIMHPAGAIQSLDLRTPRAKAPWLRITANGPFHRELMPGYLLERDAAGGSIRIDGPAGPQPTGLGKPARLRDGAGHCWQFVLLDVRIPQATAGIAQEAEPRADWYLRDDPGCRKR